MCGDAWKKGICGGGARSRNTHPKETSHLNRGEVTHNNTGYTKARQAIENHGIVKPHYNIFQQTGQKNSCRQKSVITIQGLSGNNGPTLLIMFEEIGFLDLFPLCYSIMKD